MLDSHNTTTLLTYVSTGDKINGASEVILPGDALPGRRTLELLCRTREVEDAAAGYLYLVRSVGTVLYSVAHLEQRNITHTVIYY